MVYSHVAIFTGGWKSQGYSYIPIYTIDVNLNVGNCIWHRIIKMKYTLSYVLTQISNGNYVKFSALVILHMHVREFALNF
jgi:hypothetical protein